VRERKVRPSFGIALNPSPIRFAVGQRLERDQSPRDVARAFVREEIPDEIAAAARDDAVPGGRVFGERRSLVRGYGSIS